jgi:hypothetical protein
MSASALPPSHDCPEVDPDVHLYVRTLHRACVKMGGIAALAQRLGVASASVLHWLDGMSPVPQHIFLKSVDIITSEL